MSPEEEGLGRFVAISADMIEAEVQGWLSGLSVPEICGIFVPFFWLLAAELSESGRFRPRLRPFNDNEVTVLQLLEKECLPAQSSRLIYR